MIKGVTTVQLQLKALILKMLDGEISLIIGVPPRALHCTSHAARCPQLRGVRVRLWPCDIGARVFAHGGCAYDRSWAPAVTIIMCADWKRSEDAVSLRVQRQPVGFVLTSQVYLFFKACPCLVQIIPVIMSMHLSVLDVIAVKFAFGDCKVFGCQGSVGFHVFA